MKYMVMHKSSVQSEAEQMPSQELIANVGKLLKGAMEAGTFVDAAGLRSSAHRVRVSKQDGQRFEQKGPYHGQRELVSGVALLKVKSMPEAIAWSARFAKVAGDVDFEVGTVTEPWDLGVVPKPEGELPLRVLTLLKADAQSEAGGATSAQQTAQLEQLVEEARQAGVYVSGHSLLPSAKGARISGPQGARRVVDGPFSESKELIAGFMIMEFGSKKEAETFAVQYADVVGTPEVDVREVR